MKKRILALLVAMSMMTSLAACGAIDDEKYDEFIPLISTDSDSNTDSQTTTDSASGDDSSVPEQTEDPAVTTTANPEEPSSSDTNATDNSSLTNSQSETTTTTTQGENSGSVTTTPASGSSTTTTTTTAKNPTSSTTTTTTKKPTSSTTTTTTKKPTSSTTTTTTKKPTSSTTTTRKTTTTTTTTTKKTTTTTTTTTAHKHSYTSKITKNATCVAAGEKTYTCSCGHSYTEGISATGHSYTSKVVSATTNAAGYTLHTCSKCSDSYKDAYKFLAPATFTCSGKPVTSATLNWSTISGADGYIIEKSTDSGSTWTRAKKVTGGSSSSYTVTSLTPATSYLFRVKAYKIVGEDVYYGANCVLTFYTQLSPVTLTSTASDSTLNSITLKWNKVTGAGGYEIQQYNGSAWTTIKTISSGSTLSHTVSDLHNGTTYKFRIRAKSTAGSAYSTSWTEKSISTQPPAGSVMGYSSTKNSISLNWISLETLANGYYIELYKGTEVNSKNHVDTFKVAGSSKTTYTISNLSAGTTYTIVFYAYRTLGSDTYKDGNRIKIPYATKS